MLAAEETDACVVNRGSSDGSKAGAKEVLQQGPNDTAVGHEDDSLPIVTLADLFKKRRDACLNLKCALPSGRRGLWRRRPVGEEVIRVAVLRLA